MKLTRSFYSSADLCLDNLDQLFDSGLYEASLSPYLSHVGQVVAATLATRLPLPPHVEFLQAFLVSTITPPLPLPE